MSVELLPADEYNQRTINQGHPPTWKNPPGSDYDLVVIGGGPAGLIAALAAAAGGHRVNILETEVTTATRVAEFMFDKGLAQVERPRDIRAWIEGQLYKPEYLDYTEAEGKASHAA